MNPTAELTIYQSLDNAEHRAVLARFWRRRCLACGELIESSEWARYCGNTCNQRHRRALYGKPASREVTALPHEDRSRALADLRQRGEVA